MPLALHHPGLRFATALASLHCAHILPADGNLNVVRKVLNDSRRFLAALRQLLSFTAFAHVAVTVQVIVTACTAMPESMPVYTVLWLVWIILPLIALPMALTPSETPDDGEDRAQFKRDASGLPLWDIVPGPAAPASSLPEAAPDVPPSTAGVERREPQLDGSSMQDESVTNAFIAPSVHVSSEARRASAVPLTLKGIGGVFPSEQVHVDVAPSPTREAVLEGARWGHADAVVADTAGLNDEDAAAALAAQHDEQRIVFSDEPEVDGEGRVPAAEGTQAAEALALDAAADALVAAKLAEAGVTTNPASAATAATQEGESEVLHSATLAEVVHAALEAMNVVPPDQPVAAPAPAANAAAPAAAQGGASIQHATATTAAAAPAASSQTADETVVRSESLIRYGAYADWTSSVAGHSVDISAASARMIHKHWQTARAASMSTGGSNRASFASAAAAFTQSITPKEGLLATPPTPVLPPTLPFFCLALACTILPAALFHEYLFERVFAAGVGVAGGSLRPLRGGAYPLLRVDAQADVLDLDANAVIPRAAAWAHSLVVFSWVLWFVASSAHFVFRSHPVWRDAPTRNKTWVAGCVLAIVAQIVYSHILARVHDMVSPFSSSMPGDVWGAMFAFQVLAFAWLAYVKTWDAKRFERDMTRLRAYYDTRLGMYSPR